MRVPDFTLAAEFHGDFEAHVTVHCDEPELPDLAAWAASSVGTPGPGTATAMKVTHIVLGRGRVRSQPMLTITGSGTLTDQYAAVLDLERQLVAGGFAPVRTKIEASPWATGVPQDEAQARRLGPAFYFEHHIKLVLNAGLGWDALVPVALEHGAHVSWNARRVLDGGRHERFVTQRCHEVGLTEAGRRMEALCAALRDGGFEIVSVEREFVVFDSDASVDDGWIEQRGASS